MRGAMWIRSVARRALRRSGLAPRRRPKNLVVIPRPGGMAGGGRRALLVASRLEAGLAAAGGTLVDACGEDGALMIRAREATSSDDARHALEAAGVTRVSFESWGEEGSGLPREFSPEIAFIPSPLEDEEGFREARRAIAAMDGIESVLLYESRFPLMPDRVVDVTGSVGMKEALGPPGAQALLLNQYRSATNMRGHGFAEAFQALAPGALGTGGEGPEARRDVADPGPIPFYAGCRLLAEETVADWEPSGERRRVLVLSPHFDDETIGCGGTIIRHAEAGDRVTVAFMTDGREGDPREGDRDRVGRIRRAEALEATSRLGVERLEFFDAPETRLSPGGEVESRLEYALREIDPDVLYLPSFLDNHIDHLELNRIVYRVLGRWRTAAEIRLFPLWTLIPPNLVVDIGGVAGRKSAAVNRYRSQITQVDYLSVVTSLNRYWSHRYRSDPRGRLEVFHACGADAYRQRMVALGLDREVRW